MNRTSNDDALRRSVSEQLRMEAHTDADDRTIDCVVAMIEEERKSRLQAIADWRAEKKRAEAAEKRADDHLKAWQRKDEILRLRNEELKEAEKSLDEFRRKWGHHIDCDCHTVPGHVICERTTIKGGKVAMHNHPYHDPTCAPEAK